MLKIPWFQAQTDAEEIRFVTRVLRSQYLNDGLVTRQFEAQIASAIGVKHCVGVTSGTAAITLALMGLGVGPGDEVLVPDLTFIATANAVRLAGAQVKLVDIEPDRLSIDPDKAAKAVGPKTKAMVTVDVNGRGAHYEVLEPLAKKNGLFIVCDAAEALGSKYRGRFLGTTGDAGCFSFSPNKSLTTGQGGMIATNNTKLYYRLLELKDQGRRQQGTGGNDLHPVIGYNFKLTNLQAAVGLAQWKKFKKRASQARRREIWYREMLQDCPGLRFLEWNASEGELLQWTDVLIDARDKVEKALTKAKIGSRMFWYPLHTQKPYQTSGTSFPISCDVSSKGLWLPSVFDLTKEKAKRVCDITRSAC
ncbi:MAG: DegT/DnrJ/EryC1/StrS family aminotransferase [Elusimicrobia bacterium]|nr:DegT/DnrJ/EryC1/StrS family aminotransferase [Candidatus Obscuribacterium magneticum]